MYLDFLERFKNNISGLRDFVELIEPMLNQHHKKEEEKHETAFKPLVLARQIEITEDPIKKSELKEHLKDIFDGEIEVTTQDLEGGKEDGEHKKFGFNIKGDTAKIDAAFEFQVKSSEQRNLLYKNSFISLLSSAEWFYSQLLHYFYDKNPHVAGLKKKTLTFEELKSFGTVEDAEKYLIDSKIDGILRSSFTDWLETLKSELNLGLGYLKDFTIELIEIYQRRNLLVHNGGIVNSIYLSKIEGSEFKLGDTIDVDEKYLENAIDKVHVLFSLIACELWKKDSDDDEERSYFLMDMNYGYLKQEKWGIAKLPNTFLAKDSKQNTVPKTYALLNCFFCDKNIAGLDSIKGELDKLDYSDKTVIIQLALSALKEDSKSFFALLPRAINSEELRVEDLFDFPIFKEMRELAEFEKFISKNPKTIEYLEQE